MVPEKTSSKRRRVEEKDETPNSTPKREKTDSPISRKREKCQSCKQFDDGNLKIITFPEELDAEKRPFTENELDLMLDDTLKFMVDSGEINDDLDEELSVEIKITEFSFYHGKCGHLIPLGSLDGNKSALITGYAIKITNDDVELDKKEARPIKQIEIGFPWIFTANSADEKNLIGVSSFKEPCLHFYLGCPSELYREIFLTYKELSYLIKAVQNVLTENPDFDFDDFLSELNNYDVPEDVGGILTEDTLLKNAAFILAHCKSLDSTRDDDEVELLETQALRHLQKLIGFKSKKDIIALVPPSHQPRATQKEPKVLNVKATTTSIIRQIFEGSLFSDTIRSEDNVKIRTKKHCGKCPICVAPDCGKCTNCRNMTKFGGTGKSKQACSERTCLNLAEIDSSSDTETKPTKNRSKKSNGSKDLDTKEIDLIDYSDIHDIAIQSKNRISFKIDDSEIVRRSEKGNIYRSIGKVWKSGNFVTVSCPTENGLTYVEGCARYFIKNVSGDIKAHVSWMQPANESILGVTADNNEYFFNGQCSELGITKIQPNHKMTYFDVPQNWNLLGGEDHAENLPNTKFVRQWYDDSTYRFYYPKVLQDKNDPAFCPDCRCKVPDLIVPPFDAFTKTGDAILTKFTRRGTEFSIDDDVLLDPDAFEFDHELHKAKPTKNYSKKEDFDPLYPEKRRKNDYVKGSNDKISVPYKVGRIIRILILSADMPDLSKGKTASEENITLVIRKFYRPEDAGKTSSSDPYGMKRLFWSEEEVEVCLGQVYDKCLVLCDLDYKMTTSLDSYLEGGPKRFFFEESFNAEDGSFEIVGKSTQKLNVTTSGRKAKAHLIKTTPTIPDPHPTIARPLKSMDLFAGCGGLSRGFHDSGVADTQWAVEFDTHAAKAFKKNFPDAIVYEDDCNVILDALIQGKKQLNRQDLPTKGDVELLCGGPPCQGFSGMNRFTKSEYSKFRNSLVVTFFGFVDVLRPKFVVMENVRAFVSYKQNMVLKLTLRALQRLGYQCTFGVLQAGSYGVPQTRRRAFIIAAAPCEILPIFPEPTHCFADKGLSLSVNIDSRRYEMPESFTSGSAPFSTVTVEQALNDLPEIGIGNENDFELQYNGEPQTYFQKLLRKNSTILFDHMTRALHPLIAARIERIPKAPGSDWRDLINDAVQQHYVDKKGVKQVLNIDKLRYEFGPRGPGGHKLGVCSCNEGRACDYRNNKQDNTLIPWCLPHTADRHNNWAGLYGRIDWNGFFSTCVTNPEPMGKQGRVLHPQQNRIVSVRETARAQGFPDCHRFNGDVLRRYRQVGNAVPPPLACALGLQLKVCLAEKQKAADVVE